MTPEELRREGRKVLAPGSGRGKAAAEDGEREGAAKVTWSIVLATFRGDGAASQAASALKQIRTEGGLPEAFSEERESSALGRDPGTTVVVAYGAFSDPTEARAKAELERVRTVRVREGSPYAYAFIGPSAQTTEMGSRPEYNLVKAKEQYGDKALYTLQIAVYGRDDLARTTEADLKEARHAAEEAAAKLRQEGELAFYYHGPNRSMVTVGVFGTEDYDPQAPGLRSKRLEEAKLRNPYNLYNGAGIREKRPGRESKMQGNSLVEIPKK